MNGIFVAMTVMNWTFAWHLQRRFSELICGISALGMQAVKLFYELPDLKEGVAAFREKRDAALHRSFAHRDPAGRRIEKRAFTDIF